MYRRIIKRSFDIIFSLLLLVLLSPIFLALSLLQFLFMGRPVLFSQTRPGLNGSPFTLIKFRSLPAKVDHLDNSGQSNKQPSRYGTFLRKSSLDEIPELWNILRGDMSFVGPRPLLMEYLDFYSPNQHRRHEVRPGLTGLAQVYGRNDLPWNERFSMDVAYVDECSFTLDFKILVRTLKVTMSRAGVGEGSGLDVEPFRG